VAAAGEHYVLSRLCLNGYIAALAPKGVPATDIVVTDIAGSRLFAVQVKARLDKGTDKGWHMSRKHEDITPPSLFYCFVDFGDGKESIPVTFIVPSKIVAEVLKWTHQAWLQKPGKNNRAHKDTDFRRFVPDYGFYLGSECGEYGCGWLDHYKEAWQTLPK